MTVYNPTLQIESIGSPELVWAVPAIHGDLDRLMHIHDQIFNRFKVGHRLVYLGNYTGYGQKSADCIDELLTFRRLLLSLSGMECSDILYLRGAQEEMLQKLYQLPFAPAPTDTFLWMLGNGMSGTLRSYGLCEHDGIEACRGGVMMLTKWVERVRVAVRSRKGHEAFSTQLLRACHTAQKDNEENALLFVNAGVDPDRTLAEQGDRFWWSGGRFFTECSGDSCTPFQKFHKVIRGYDSRHQGMVLDKVHATIDDGCGFGGGLVSVAFNARGEADCILRA
jgi:hypothetical protein